MGSFLLVTGAVLAAAAAALHVYIFVLESVLWTRPSTWRVFGLRSQADAETTRPLAYNQGFYNLFLAIGVVVGIALLPVNSSAGVTLLLASTLSMVLAALVLVTSNRPMLRAAAMQGVLPLLAALSVALSFAF
ncbi:putative membrane protein [Marisediminicola sp. UYEF4]|uniref:DUF1304 domain-containing protein n=1 Tax=Marisediminicola sp. UYEF4 TaxID=1756384 RepID=UPI003398B2DF